MKVNCKNTFKKAWLIMFLCVLTANAFATSIELLKYKDEESKDINSTDNLLEISYDVDTTAAQPSTILKNKNFVLLNSTAEDGQLFFEMRSGNLLVSESSAAALLLLGFLGFFSRRWL